MNWIDTVSLPQFLLTLLGILISTSLSLLLSRRAASVLFSIGSAVETVIRRTVDLEGKADMQYFQLEEKLDRVLEKDSKRS